MGKNFNSSLFALGLHMIITNAFAPLQEEFVDKGSNS
jgi:hypothetical protein